MRIKFKPWLTNGKIIYNPNNSFPTFKDALLYTIDDYKDYIEIPNIQYNTNASDKCTFLLSEINKINNTLLINLIETNYDKFPDVPDHHSNLLLEENFNNRCKHGKHYKQLLKP